MFLRDRTSSVVMLALAFFCLVLQGNTAPAQSTIAGKNDFTIAKITESCRIDGVLDEPFWRASGVSDGGSRRLGTPRSCNAPYRPAVHAVSRVQEA